jgi:hypothetical protein
LIHDLHDGQAEQTETNYIMNVLVIDIGGTYVKILATGQKERRRFESGPNDPRFGLCGELRALDSRAADGCGEPHLPQGGVARMYCTFSQPKRVAQISNLPYRGFVIRRPLGMSDTLPNAIRRHSRLKICATQLGSA